jgi:hypothetical protein
MRLLFLLASLAIGHAAAAQVTAPADAIEKLLARLEQVIASGDRSALVAMASPDADTDAIERIVEPSAGKPTRVVIKERDRQQLERGRQRLLLEVFVERGTEGELVTWGMDLDPRGGADWRIEALERLTRVGGLYRLTLNSSRQFDIRNLTLRGTDLTIEMATGSAFVAETVDGPTAVVLVGRGRMRFAPPDEAERTQVRIFAGSDALTAEFDGALIRVRPSEFESRFPSDALVRRDAVTSDFRRAGEIFEEFIGKTLQLDLTDLSRDRWSLIPSSGDLIAEVRTRQYGNLTYARAGSEAEDVTIFDRRRRRNIAVYASPAKLASRGQFYSEDDLVDYDVLAYEIEASFSPERLWINGTARLRIKPRSSYMTTMQLKLAEALTVRGVYAQGMGRLLHLRVVGQNSLILSLPAPVQPDTELVLTVVYSGRLESQELEREAIAVQQQQQQQQERESAAMPLEPRFLYSNRSYWYPQSTVTDYALATLRLTVPQEFDVVASGTRAGPPKPSAASAGSGQRPHQTFTFECDRPARYLSFVASRLNPVTSAKLDIRTAPASTDVRPLRSDGQGTLGTPSSFRSSSIDEPSPRPSDPAPAPAAENTSFALTVQANPRQMGRARSFGEQASSILQFYASILGEAPYPSFTLAVTENDLPGGHSPAYFAVLNQSLPTSPVVWQNDPVAFENFPSFFIAHELAHQWWGQAVGWKNYHEQWLSEGFAQYFATLYAEKDRGHDVFDSIVRKMRRWAIDSSPQGPVYLGYRLGHIKGDSRVFRAIIYNKAAMVLHMLRRLVGDDPFFWGMRRFYAEWRFRKAGTDDFRKAMEASSGRDLTTFFQAWIHGSGIPRLRFSYQTPDPASVLVRFEHVGEQIEVPVTVTLTYASGETEEFVVPVSERTVERKLAVKAGATLRRVEANADHAALAEIEK